MAISFPSEVARKEGFKVSSFDTTSKNDVESIKSYFHDRKISVSRERIPFLRSREIPKFLARSGANLGGIIHRFLLIGMPILAPKIRICFRSFAF